jgi:exodeoxyribonuclease VII large subunit
MPSRMIELSATGDELVVRFAYNATLVDVVRGISRRRFDRAAKYWACPLEIVVEVVDALVDHGFALAADVRARYVEKGGKGLLSGEEGSSLFDAGAFAAPATVDGANGLGAERGVDGAGAALLVDRARAPGASGPAPTAGPVSLTVSELNARVHRTLARAFPELLWVVGEITGFDRNRHRAHVHFQLMEKEPEGVGADVRPLPQAEMRRSSASGGGIKASVDAVLFARTRAAIEKKLAASDSPFELKDGIEVRLGVRVELYEPKGAFQLVVEEIDPVHTLGKLAQNRAAVLAELEKRGLREKNATLPWPDVPLRVGLITSLGSDAYNDFLNELGRSGYAFEITVADTRMQGQGLERGVVAAIRSFRERAGSFDAIAIVRGGGAKTDLMWFDNLQVALAVATCPIKVISGIGHQRDVSVIDLIAHPEKTPTAAAAALVARVQAFEQRLIDAVREVADLVQARLELERGRVSRAGHGLVASARSIGREQRERLRGALARLRPATRERLRGARRLVDEARLRLASLGRAQARLQRSALARLRQRLDPRALARHLDRSGAKLAALDQLAQSLHPKSVLKRGFAIVRDAAGRTLRDAASIARGSEIVASLARGRLRARVEGTDAEPERSRGGGA